jgi:hypothetical protein
MPQSMPHTMAGLGAKRDDIPIRVSSITEPERSLIGTGFPFKNPELVAVYQRQFAAVMPATSGIRRAGAAALDLADVACGRFEAFWELVLFPWDYAAGILLVQEAGGIITALDGSPIPMPLVRTPIVPSNPDHGWLVDIGGARRERAQCYSEWRGSRSELHLRRHFTPTPVLVEWVQNFSEVGWNHRRQRPSPVAVAARSPPTSVTRTVVAFVAPPPLEAAFVHPRATRIDLRASGEHLVGAPMSSLRAARRATCNLTARRHAEASDGLDSHLYERATRPERENLADNAAKDSKDPALDRHRSSCAPDFRTACVLLQLVRWLSAEDLSGRLQRLTGADTSAEAGEGSLGWSNGPVT